jgi:hypothetical protein
MTDKNKHHIKTQKLRPQVKRVRTIKTLRGEQLTLVFPLPRIVKRIRLKKSELALITRACRKLNPSPSVSDFMERAAVKRARIDLGMPAA